MVEAFYEHELTRFCWCHPVVVVDEETGRTAVFHYQRALSYDPWPRATCRFSKIQAPV